MHRRSLVVQGLSDAGLCLPLPLHLSKFLPPASLFITSGHLSLFKDSDICRLLTLGLFQGDKWLEIMGPVWGSRGFQPPTLPQRLLLLTHAREKTVVPGNQAQELEVGAGAAAPPQQKISRGFFAAEFPWEHAPVAPILGGAGSLRSQDGRTSAGGLSRAPPLLWPPALTNLKSSYRQNLPFLPHLI